MNIRKLLTLCLLATGLALGIGVPEQSSAKDRKVVVKHKRKHHRHRVGLKHVGRGTKRKTVVKTSH